MSRLMRVVPRNVERGKGQCIRECESCVAEKLERKVQSFCCLTLIRCLLRADAEHLRPQRFHFTVMITVRARLWRTTTGAGN